MPSRYRETALKVLEALRAKARILKKEIAALYYAYRDPCVPMLPKLVIVFTVGYALSPIDLIPDFIPILGYLDDLLILPALIVLSVKLIPRERMVAARRRAEEHPPRLKENRVFAALFISLWIFVIFLSVQSLIAVFAG